MDKDLERYIIRLGKYGAYFYDVKLEQAKTLKDVAYIMNKFYTMLINDGYIL